MWSTEWPFRPRRGAIWKAEWPPPPEGGCMRNTIRPCRPNGPEVSKGPRRAATRAGIPEGNLTADRANRFDNPSAQRTMPTMQARPDSQNPPSAHFWLATC